MKNIILFIFGFITLNATADPGLAIKPLVISPSCYGSSNGSIQLSVYGGVAPYKIQWNHDLPEGATQTHLAAGTYNVTITDDENNVRTTSVVLTQPREILLSTTVRDIENTIHNTGEINLQVSGGTPGYTFNWSNSSHNQNLWDVASGNYSVVVTDASGCTATTSASVHEMRIMPIPTPSYTVMENQMDIRQKAKSSPTAITETATTELSVYPVPAANFFNVKGLDNGSEISLVNMNGQVVEQQKYSTSEVQMNVSNVPVGTYVMVIKSGDQVTTKPVSIAK